MANPEMPTSMVNDLEARELILKLLQQRGKATEDTLSYYVVLASAIKMYQGMLQLLECGDVDAGVIEGRTGDDLDDYQVRLTTKGRR